MPLQNAQQADAPPSSAGVEPRIREIAGALYSFLKQGKPSFFAAGGWKKSVIEGICETCTRISFRRYLETPRTLAAIKA